MNKLILILLFILIFIIYSKYILNSIEINQSLTILSNVNKTKLNKILRNSSIYLKYSTNKSFHRKIYNDFIELSNDLRKYSLTKNKILEKNLFPWLFNINNLTIYKGKKSSKGIVICTGSNHFSLTLIALKALEIIENKLPIEIMYSTSNDLSINHQNILKKSFVNIKLIDLSLKFVNDNYLKLRGWEIKPFAVLASTFEQVLLMDADVLFLEKPKILFKNFYYLKSGTLFFYDRPSLSFDNIQWINQFLYPFNQFLPKRTQESGVVLIDKSRVFNGLLITCKLNDFYERNHIIYKYFHGDKDTWWLGFHLINISYSFIPTLTASIGEIQNNQVCGHILHLNEYSQPIWWNGGIFRNRYINTNELLNINGWLEEGQWTIQTYSCLNNLQKIPKLFHLKHQQLIFNYTKITKDIFIFST